MTDAVQVREAEPRDAHAWATMRAALWPEADAAELADEVKHHFVDTPLAAAVFIADVGNSPSGFLELSLRSVAEACTTSPVPYIEAWYVRAAVQCRGIGRRLLDAAERWARDRGYSEIASDAVLSNTIGDAVHRRLGFAEVERAIHYRKPLV